MATVNRCPQCGCDTPPDSPAGLCPNCLLGAGLAAPDPRDAAPPVTEAAPAAPAAPFVPPKPHALAARFPQFEIIDLLGYGGMGAVYKARQKSLDRFVALKIIKPDAVDKQGFAERFEREARALAKLSHSNIVSIHDSGKTDGLYYFVMEYVDGTNLRRLIESKALAPEQAITIIPQVCEALQFAHDEGIVHRDIKPENILVDSRGRVKIADFGLAKLLGKTSIDDHTLTGTLQVMGTPRYMAPEQMLGSKLIDHRADIYSLGVVFYEMLTGELPMGNFEPPSRKSSVDARLDEVVLRSLAKEPERRYQHVSDINSDLQSIQSFVAPQPSRGRYASTDALSADVDSRFSRKAIVGACWLPLFFLGLVAAVAPAVTIRVSSGEQPPQWSSFHYVMLVLVAIIGLIGLAAPFGTTILGWIALNDIRHSRGALRGLGLAFFDAIFFPLLFLDVFVAIVVVAVMRLLLSSIGNTVYPAAWVMLVVLLMNIPFVWWCWRRASGATRMAGAPITAGRAENQTRVHETDKPAGAASAAGKFDATDADTEKEQKLDEAEESPQENLEWAAWCIGLVGAFRAWMLVSAGGKVFDQLASGDLSWLNYGLVIQLTGPVMVIAALMTYRARFYWLAIVGAILCLPTGNCLPVIFGIYALVILFDPKVHALFRANEAFFSDAGVWHTVGHDTAKPAMPRGYGDQIGSTLGSAWTEWWRERDALCTRAVQAVIMILHIVCLLAFLGFTARRATNDVGQSVFTHHIGLPSPWFTIETISVGNEFEFNHAIHWTTSAWIVVGAGMALAYVYCRIEKVRNPEITFWHKPQAFLFVWGVLALIDIAMGAGLGFLAMDATRTVRAAPPVVIEPATSGDTTAVTPTADHGTSLGHAAK